jgi:hypothetical protein
MNYFQKIFILTASLLAAVGISHTASSQVIVSGNFESSGFVDTFTGGTFEGSFSFQADLDSLTGTGPEFIDPLAGTLSFSLTPNTLDGQALDMSFVEASMIFDGGDLSFVSLHGSPSGESVIEINSVADFAVVYQFPDPSFSVPASSNIVGVQAANTSNDLEGAGLFGSGAATGTMSITLIPEPSALGLLGLGGLALLLLRRRRVR